MPWRSPQWCLPLHGSLHFSETQASEAGDELAYTRVIYAATGARQPKGMLSDSAKIGKFFEIARTWQGHPCPSNGRSLRFAFCPGIGAPESKNPGKIAVQEL